MTKRKKYSLVGIAAFLALAAIAAFIAASILARRFEPMIREQAIAYLHDRFHADVQLTQLKINPPKMSTLDILLRHGRGALVTVEVYGLSMRLDGTPDLPPLFSIRKLQFVVDLGSVIEKRKHVDFVAIQGMEINIPPKGDRPHVNVASSDSNPEQVLINDVQIRDAALVLLPKDSDKKPMRFDIARLHLKSVGVDRAMKYDASLAIPTPPGTVQSQGDFGPWAAGEPGDTPLKGDYSFDNADLGVFSAIAGTLSSTGTFDGTLDTVQARGQATVPNFRLKMAGNPLRLTTRFEVLVDGTNGNTVLKPVQAKLGNTSFTTTGAVIKHEKQPRREISLKVDMPHGDMRDLLRLATKGAPFMEGIIHLAATIGIPPLTSTVKEKLLLDGNFELSDAKFLKSSIQDQIDQLSRRGQGQPKNEEIDEVVSNMKGSFRLENQVMTFRDLSFAVPGAAVALSGVYDLNEDTVDFSGNLKLAAHLSQTQSGWKRFVLKPVDPFFAKNGAGTFLRIRVDGSAQKPKFGLDRKRREEPAKLETGVAGGR